MFLTIFMLFILINTTKGNITINLNVYLEVVTLLGIFIVQAILFFYTFYKYKNNIHKCSMINIKKSIIHVILGIITIVLGLGIMLYSTQNLIFKILLIIMGLELIIIRLLEVTTKYIEKFSEFNFNFEPKCSYTIIKNKKFIKLTSKESITNTVILSIFIGMIFSGVYTYVFKLNSIPLSLNLIIFIIAGFFLSPKHWFFLDQILENYIIAEFEFLDSKNDGNGAQPGLNSICYYSNENFKLKVSFEIPKNQKKEKKITLIIGGISHKVIGKI